MWVEVRKKIWMVLMWVAERSESTRVIQHMKCVKAKSYLSMVFAAVEIKTLKKIFILGTAIILTSAGQSLVLH